MYDYLKKLITPDMVFFGLPSGPSTAIDLTGKNPKIQCYGTHPNVPVISTFQPPNILMDGGLNIWTSATNLTNWTEYTSGTSTVNREPTEKTEGDFSCRLDVDGSNSTAYVRQSPSLTPLKKYKVIAWYRNSIAGKTARIQLKDSGSNVYLKSDGTWNVGDASITLSNSTAWKRFELEFRAHANYSAYIFFLMSNSAASSSIYFDNVSIEELKPSLINPSVGWHFDRIDDYIAVPDSPVFDVGGELTIGAVINPLGSASQDVIMIHNFPNYLWMLYCSGAPEATLDFYIRTALGNSQAGSTSSLLDAKWHLMIATYNRTLANKRLKLFVDTVLETWDDGYDADISTGNDGGLHLGSQYSSLTSGFHGYIALPFATNKAWSQAQVNNFGDAIKGLFSPRGF